MDVFSDPSPWPNRPRDPHLLYAAGLLSFTGYLLFVLVLAILEPGQLTRSAAGDTRIAVRVAAPPIARAEAPPPAAIEAAAPTSMNSDAAPAEVAPDSTPLAAEREIPQQPADAAAARSATGDRRAPRLDLTLPQREPELAPRPVCRAGPCAPGTARLPAVRPKRRSADEILSDLDPDVLESLDLEALGIDPDLADVFGERRVGISRNCDLVQRADTVVTRQMGSPQFLRCRRSSTSKARAQALLDALREKRPDLFEDR